MNGVRTQVNRRSVVNRDRLRAYNLHYDHYDSRAQLNDDWPYAHKL